MLTMFSGCETFEPQDNPVNDLPQENGSEFLITAKIGADTKTYLEWDDTAQVYKTRWTKDDYIYLIDATQQNLKYETCHVLEGAGTSTAIFPATLEASSYVALYAYGGGWHADTMTPYVQIWSVQNHFSQGNNDQQENKAFINRAYPMVAKSQTKDLEFYNLCSVLKFTVTGNGEFLRNIRVTSNAGELLAGSADVDIMSDIPSMTMTEGTDWVDYNVYQTLTQEPIECYVVLPAQTYSEGFTLTFHTDNGWMDVTTGPDIMLEQSRLHEIKDPVTYQSEGGHWILGISGGDDLIMENRDGYYVMENAYLDYTVRFYNDFTGEILTLDSQYGMGYYPLNTRIALESEDNGTWMPRWGNFDVYLYPEEKAAYIMDRNLPTNEHVYQSMVDALWYVEDGQKVMVSGIVKAVCQKGYILAMGYKDYNNVLVFNSKQNNYYLNPGHHIEIYTEKNTYRNLPELVMTEESWFCTYDYNLNVSFYEEGYLDLTYPESFMNYEGGRYDYVMYSGTLIEDNGKYFVEVDGVEGRRGYLFYPNEDMSYLVGKTVNVKGYFIGFIEESGDLCTMISSVIPISEAGGSTEDFYLGEDIQM